MTSMISRNSRQIPVTHFSTEWKIPDFFPLGKKYREVKSPAFQYLSAKWRIDVRKTDGFWELFIVKDVLCPTFLWAYYTIGIKKIDGTVYKSKSGKILVGAINDIERTHNFLRPSDLLQDQMEIAPQNVLVVFCSLCIKESLYDRMLSNAALQSGNSVYKSQQNFIEKKVNKQIKGSQGTLDILPGLQVCSENMKDMLRSELFSDVVIKVHCKEFKAHKVILASRSPVLSAMMQHDMQESRTGNIYINDCSPNVFVEFLEYLYTGQIGGLTRGNICEVYKLADKYDVKQLRSDCVAIMKKYLSVGFFCDIMSLSVEYDETELRKSATDFFLKNMKSILLTDEWQPFIVGNPIVAHGLFFKVERKTENT